MPAIEPLKPAEWQRIKAIDAAYGQAKKFYEAAGIGRGAFKSLALNGTGLTETLIKVRDEFNRLDASKDATPAKILQMVADEWKISVEDVRSGKVALARQAAAYLLERETDLKNKEIAAEIGYADHTGVLVALRSFSDRLDTEPLLRRRMLGLRAKIQNP